MVLGMMIGSGLGSNDEGGLGSNSGKVVFGSDRVGSYDGILGNDDEK